MRRAWIAAVALALAAASSVTAAASTVTAPVDLPGSLVVPNTGPTGGIQLLAASSGGVAFRPTDIGSPERARFRGPAADAPVGTVPADETVRSLVDDQLVTSGVHSDGGQSAWSTDVRTGDRTLLATFPTVAGQDRSVVGTGDGWLDAVGPTVADGVTGVTRVTRVTVVRHGPDGVQDLGSAPQAGALVADSLKADEHGALLTVATSTCQPVCTWATWFVDFATGGWRALGDPYNEVYAVLTPSDVVMSDRSGGYTNTVTRLRRSDLGVVSAFPVSLGPGRFAATDTSTAVQQSPQGLVVHPAGGQTPGIAVHVTDYSFQFEPVFAAGDGFVTATALTGQPQAIASVDATTGALSAPLVVATPTSPASVGLSAGRVTVTDQSLSGAAQTRAAAVTAAGVGALRTVGAPADGTPSWSGDRASEVTLGGDGRCHLLVAGPRGVELTRDVGRPVAFTMGTPCPSTVLRGGRVLLVPPTSVIPVQSAAASTVIDLRDGATTAVPGSADLWGDRLVWSTSDGSVFARDLATPSRPDVRLGPSDCPQVPCVAKVQVHGDWVAWLSASGVLHAAHLSATGAPDRTDVISSAAAGARLADGLLAWLPRYDPAEDLTSSLAHVAQLMAAGPVDHLVAQVQPSDGGDRIALSDELVGVVERDRALHLLPVPATAGAGPQSLGPPLLPSALMTQQAWAGTIDVSRPLTTWTFSLAAPGGSTVFQQQGTAPRGGVLVTMAGSDQAWGQMPSGTYTWTLTGRGSGGALAPVRGTLTYTAPALGDPSTAGVVTPAHGSVATTVSWPASLPGSTYEVDVSTRGAAGPWSAPRLVATGLTQTSLRWTGRAKAGTSLRFTVRARGTASSTAGALVASSTVRLPRATGWSGTSQAQTGVAGSRLTLRKTFAQRRTVVVVGRTCPDCGTVRASIDGVRVATRSTSGDVSSGAALLRFSVPKGKHTITLSVSQDAVTLQGLALL